MEGAQHRVGLAAPAGGPRTPAFTNHRAVGRLGPTGDAMGQSVGRVSADVVGDAVRVRGSRVDIARDGF